MAVRKLNFLLMGKTGHGKSSTGNIIIGRQYFKTSFNSTSETKEVSFNATEFNGYLLLVVDGPGLEDTDMDNVQDKDSAIQNMTKALALCYGGVHAFLFVLRFGNRFTVEEKKAMESCKRIFGETYINNVIVIMTCGDLFLQEMEDATVKETFDEWCRNQRGELRKLYDDCNGRFVLFNNKEKDEGKRQEQVKKVVQITLDLQRKYGRYTSENFKQAEIGREKYTIENRAQILTEEFQVAISLLSGEIEMYSKNPSDAAKQKIQFRVNELKRKIKDVDKGHGVFSNLIRQLESVEKNLDNVVQLQNIAQELEETKKAKSAWGKFVSALKIIGKAIVIAAGAVMSIGTAIVAPVATGAVVEATGALLSALDSEEEENVDKTQNELKKKRSLQKQLQ